MMTWANEWERDNTVFQIGLPPGLRKEYKRLAHTLSKGVGVCFSIGPGSVVLILHLLVPPQEATHLGFYPATLSVFVRKGSIRLGGP